MHACTSDQQDSVQQGEHLAFLLGTVTNVSITMHTYVPAEFFARYFADFSLSEFALFTCNVGSIFDAMLC